MKNYRRPLQPMPVTFPLIRHFYILDEGRVRGYPRTCNGFPRSEQRKLSRIDSAARASMPASCFLRRARGASRDSGDPSRQRGSEVEPKSGAKQRMPPSAAHPHLGPARELAPYGRGGQGNTAGEAYWWHSRAWDDCTSHRPAR